MRNIGTPSTSNTGGTSTGQCGFGSVINPLGILSTPVIDAQSRTIYVAGVLDQRRALPVTLSQQCRSTMAW